MWPQPGFLKCQFSDRCSSCSPQLPGTLRCHAEDEERIFPLWPEPRGGQPGAVAGLADNKALKLPVERRLRAGEAAFAGGDEAAGVQHRARGWRGAIPVEGDARGRVLAERCHPALEAKGLERLPVVLGAASLPWCCPISLGSAGGWCCLGGVFGMGGGHVWHLQVRWAGG